MSFFDFIKPIAGAAASAFGGPAAGALVSGGLNYLGTSQQNSANMASARQQQEFQAQQAQISRDWMGDQNTIDRRYNRRESSKGRTFNRREAGRARAWSNVQGGKSRAFNARQARIQRNWTERMSSTAHQRQMDDMRRAGLNPILSAKHSGAAAGGGQSASASAPGASSASGMAATSKAGGAPGAGSGAMARMENMVAPATSSALAYKSNAATVDNVRQATKQGMAAESVSRETAKKIREETKTEVSKRHLTEMDAKLRVLQAATEPVRAGQLRQSIAESRSRIPTYDANVRLSAANSARAYSEAGLADQREQHEAARRLITELGIPAAHFDSKLWTDFENSTFAKTLRGSKLLEGPVTQSAQGLLKQLTELLGRRIPHVRESVKTYRKVP